jgi:hypothetical protein
VFEEEGETFAHGRKSAFGGRAGRGFTERASALRVVDQGVRRVCQSAGTSIDDLAGDTVFYEILDALTRDRDNRSAATLGFGDRSVAPIGSWSDEEDDIHRRIERGQLSVLIAGPVDPPLQPAIPRLFFEPRLELAVAHHDRVDWRVDTGGGIEENAESPTFGELSDGADDRCSGRYPETVSPGRSVGWNETLLEWYRESECRKTGNRMAEIIFESGVSAQGTNQPPIDEAVEGVAPNVAGTAERADERRMSMNTSGHTQKMVVGEMADHDIARRGQRGDRSEI